MTGFCRNHPILVNLQLEFPGHVNEFPLLPSTVQRKRVVTLRDCTPRVGLFSGPGPGLRSAGSGCREWATLC